MHSSEKKCHKKMKLNLIGKSSDDDKNLKKSSPIIYLPPGDEDHDIDAELAKLECEEFISKPTYLKQSETELKNHVVHVSGGEKYRKSSEMTANKSKKKDSKALTQKSDSLDAQPNKTEAAFKGNQKEGNSKGQPNGSIFPTLQSKKKKTGSSTNALESNAPGAMGDKNALRSDLILAVENDKGERVKRILKCGIDPNAVCDEKGRWPIHIAALGGHSHIIKLLLEYGAQKDQPDTALERTPLLYAAAISPDAVKQLLAYKADIHSKNKFGATALHYAAGAGQSECCKLLLAAGCRVNARDRMKMTPLHMAARVDDIHSIDILLKNDADVHAKDVLGKTALHHAAETCEGVVSDYKKMGVTFKRLISAGITVNELDNNGKSALYYAIQTGSAEAVTILSDLGAQLLDGVSLLSMGKKFPALIRPFLDRCISSNLDTVDAESKHFYIQFDYTCLTYYPKDIMNDKLLSMQNREEIEGVLPEMGVLCGLTKCTDTSILSHPVCESLLRLKWKKVKWYLYLDMLLFAVFLAFLTAVIFMEYESDNTVSNTAMISNSTVEWKEGESGVNANEAGDAEDNSHRPGYCMDSTRNIIVWTILWFLTACLGIREMIQLVQAPLHYVVQMENILELVLVFSVAMLSLAECGVSRFVDARDHFAAICLIVGWTIQVTLYGKIPVFGVYIRMFAAVAVNILKCLFTYLGLLFAFSLTLHFLFRAQKEYDSVGFTLLKTFAMMIGEIELIRTFIDKRDDMHIVPFTSHLMFALFIIFISVILMSLLVALAVNDISSMQRDGEYMQLVQQVKVASQLEDALQQRSLLYPQYGMRDSKALHQRKGIFFPNLKDHGKLSKVAMEIVITQHTKKVDSENANALSQQLHSSDSPDNQEDKNKTKQEEPKLNLELLVGSIVDQLKIKIKKISSDLESRTEQAYNEIRLNLDLNTQHLSTEVAILKDQVDDINVSIRRMNPLLEEISHKLDNSKRGGSSVETVTEVVTTDATGTSTATSPEHTPQKLSSRKTH